MPCFIKQLGRDVYLSEGKHKWHVSDDDVINAGQIVLHDKKGGDINEWAEDLRVREFPRACHPERGYPIPPLPVGAKNPWPDGVEFPEFPSPLV